jgi:hypothetical protein
MTKTVTYAKTSPWVNTNIYGNFLDIINYTPVSKKPDDVLYTVDKVYEYRPDLLAYDLYGNAGLWWVFRSRNPNSIDDPIFDFRSGVTIYIPKKETLIADLGV